MLQTINLHSGYKNKSVINGISLEIRPQEIFILIGLNGSGKSTFLKTLLGLIKPTQGEILLNSKPFLQMPLPERSKYISLLESQPKVSFSISLRELLEIASRNSEKDLSKEALNALGLKGFEDKNILELSSGEAQRAFLAHALVTNSKIILMDEPFSHLDWRHQIELVDCLKEWRKVYGTTFVLAVHELDRAVQLADRLGVMNLGQLVKVGTAKEVFESKETFETFAFQATIDENPFDGSRRLTLGKKPIK